MAETKVITYFSYKGGAGRSTLALNTIPIIADENHLQATKEHPIILVDMDIDSCGMSYLLGVENQVNSENSVQHLLKNGCGNEHLASIHEDPTFSNLCKVGKKFGFNDEETVLFMPAEDVKNVKDNTNYSDDDKTKFPQRLKSFIQTCKGYGVPAVIFDCSVGNNATANAANLNANIVICCMRPTTQFVNGTIRFLGTLDSDRGAPWSGKKKIVVVPNVVPQEKVVIDNMKYPDIAISNIIDKFNPIVEDRDDDDEIQYDTSMMSEEEFGIPAVASFMWREGQLCTQQNLNDNEKLALSRYNKLADIVFHLCIKSGSESSE